jgi:hypothetical protein
MINTFNMKEAQPHQGFDPDGLFSQHLEFMRYSNLFTRIVEGTSDNDPNTPKRKEKQPCNHDVVREISFKAQ